MKRFASTTLACALAGGVAFVMPASAQASDFGSTNRPGIEFEVGGGVKIQPRFEGASEYIVGPLPLISFGRLTLSNGFEIGGGDGRGFSVSPSFNFRGERKAADTPALAPLADVDWAVELGLGAAYETENFRVHANIRRGINGHEGWVGEAGVDLIARPADGVRLYAGPRISYADNAYMDTYFSVPAGTAGFSAFDAEGGVKSWGFEAGARYDFAANWAVEGSATYDRLTGDAGKSPVTAVGSRDQYTFSLGLVRKFRIDF